MSLTTATHKLNEFSVYVGRMSCFALVGALALLLILSGCGGGSSSSGGGGDGGKAKETSGLDAPTLSFVSYGAASAELDWTEVKGAKGYIVHYGRIDGASVATSASNDFALTEYGLTSASSLKYDHTLDVGDVTKVTVSHLTANKKYKFAVTAYDDKKVSGSLSKEKAPTTTPDTPPKAWLAAGAVGASANVAAGGANVDLTWDVVAEADSYVIDYTTDSNPVAVKKTVSAVADGSVRTGFRVGSLTESTKYYFVITPQNGDATGDSSSQVTATTLVKAPDLSGDLIAVIGSAAGEVDLSWVAGTSWDSSATYAIRYAKESGVLSTKGSIAGDATKDTIDGLDAGVKYHFAISVAGGAYSKSKLATATPKFAAPSITVTASTTTGGQVDITWDKVANATGYIVDYATDSKGTGGGAKTLGDLTKDSITGLTAGTQYYFSVSAKNDLVTGDPSVDSAYAPFAAPSITVTASASTAGQVDITWDKVANATGYIVDYSTDSSGTGGGENSDVTKDSISITTGLTNGKKYYFSVRAKNANVEGVAAVSSAVAPLAKPAGIGGKGAEGQVDLTWDAVTSAQGYIVSYGTASLDKSIEIVGGSVVAATIVGLTGGTEYKFKVAAYGDDKATGVPSDELIKTPTAPAFTGVPAITAITSTAGKINLTWDKVADDTGYKIYYGTASGNYDVSKDVANTDGTGDIVGLTAGRVYYVVVSAIGTAGEGAKSAEKTVTVQFAAPTSLTAEASSTKGAEVDLTWVAVPGATGGYTVSHGIDQSSLTTYTSFDAGSTSGTVTGLTAGQSYYFAIKVDNGEQSTATNLVTALYAAPSNFVAAVSAMTDGKVDLNWDSVAGATLYTIKHGTRSGDLTNDVTSDATSRSIAGLTTGSNNYFSIKANNSIYSAEIGPVAVFTAPAGVSAKASVTTAGAIDVTWNAVAGASSSYTIHYGTAAKGLDKTADGGTGTSKTITDLTVGVEYHFAVSVTAGAKSGISKAVAPFAAPGNFGVAPSPDDAAVVFLRWSAVAGATEYVIDYTSDATDGVKSHTVAAGKTSSKITGLAGGIEYHFTLRVKNGIKTATVDVVALLGAPKNLIAKAGTNSVDLTWDGLADITVYIVYVTDKVNVDREVNVSLSAATTDGVGHAVSGLQSDVTYYFQVSGKGAGGVGEKSVEVSAVPLAPESVGSPQNVKVIASALTKTTIDVTWDATTDLDTSYKVYYKDTLAGEYDNSIAENTDGFENSTRISNLTAGTTYYITVAATKTNIEGGKSNQVSTTTVFNAVTGFAAVSSTETAGKIDLTWDKVAKATGYMIDYSADTTPASSDTTKDVAGGDTTSDSLVDLDQGKKYSFAIYAYNPHNKDATADATSDTAEATLAAPTGLKVAAGPGKADLTWDAIDDTDVKGYFMHHRKSDSTSDSEWKSVEVTGKDTRAGSVTGLDGDVTYDFKVSAYGAANNSGLRSDAKSATPSAPLLDFPAKVTVIVKSGTEVDLTWDKVDSSTLTVSGYIVKYSTGGIDTTVDVSGDETLAHSLTGLTAGTIYEFSVRTDASTDNVKSNYSAAQTYATHFTAPTNFSVNASSVIAGAIDLGWSVVANAPAYTVSYGTTSAATGLQKTGVTAVHTSITGLTQGTTYYFKVEVSGAVVGGNAVTGADSAASAGVIAPFAAPTSLAVANGPSGGSVRLSWTAVTAASGYEIHYGTTDSLGTTVSVSGGSTTQKDVAGLIAGDSYYFAIATVNGLRSSRSNAFAVPYAAPTGFSATTSSTTAATISLTWIAVPGVSEFIIKHGTSSGSLTETVEATDTSHDVSGLAAGVRHYFTISSKNGLTVDSEQSAYAPFAAPRNFSAATGSAGGDVDLTWTKVTGATDYTIHYGTAADAIITRYAGAVGNVAATTVAGLAGSTKYFFAINAKNLNVGGIKSTNAPSATTTNPPLSAPASVTATPSSTTIIDVSWDAVVNQNSITVTGYRVEFTPSGGSKGTKDISGASTLSTGLTGLSSGTTYSISVSATGTTGGNVVVGSPANVTATTNFDAVTGLGAKSSTSEAGAIDLTWDAVSNAPAYTVSYGATAAATGLQKTGVTAANVSITGLTQGTTYYFKVKVSGSVGGSEVTEAYSAASNGVVAPFAAPTLTVANGPSGGSVRLSWTAVTGASGYEIHYGTTDSLGTTVSVSGGSTTQKDVAGLTAGASYYFAIATVNGLRSSRSNVFAVPYAAPASFSAATSSTTAATISLAWSEVTGVSEFIIKHGTSSGNLTNTVVATDTSHDVSGLAAGVRHYFTISSKNGLTVDSEQSAYAPFAAPANFSAATGSAGGDVDLTWTKVAGAKDYTIHYGTVANAITTPYGTVGDVAATTVAGLAGSTEYFFAISAKNDNVGGIKSTNAPSATTTNPPPLNAPASVTATPSFITTIIDVAWDKVDNHNAITVTGYRVEFTPSGGSKGTKDISGTSTLSTSLDGLSSGTTYSISVSATGTYGGNAVVSSPANVTATTNFDAVTNLGAKSSSSAAGVVDLTWDAVARAPGYIISYGTAPNGDGNARYVAGGSTTTYTITSLTEGSLYYFKIAVKGQVSGQDVTSDYTDVVSVGAPYPALVNVGLDATWDSANDKHAIDVTWDSLTSATGYEIYYAETSFDGVTRPNLDSHATANGGAKIAGADINIGAPTQHVVSHTISGLSADKSYDVLVIGTTNNASTLHHPGKSAKTLGIVDLVQGTHHLCALLNTGVVKCWGRSSYNQVNPDSIANVLWPTTYDVTDDITSPKVTAITAGDDHTCATVEDSSVYCWGRNKYGRLGGGGNSYSSTKPHKVLVNTSVFKAKIVQGGGAATCAVDLDNKSYCWGYAAGGSLGIPGTGSSSITAREVVALTSEVTQFAIFPLGGCALDVANKLWCWGSDASTSSPFTGVVRTVDVSQDAIVDSISASRGFSCGATKQAELQCWGSNLNGELGKNSASTAGKQKPDYVLQSTTAGDRLDKVAGVSTGDKHACAWFTDTTVPRCWGLGAHGQLGVTGSTASISYAANPVSNLQNSSLITKITAGGYTSCALLADKTTIRCWGNNSYGQFGNGTTTGPVLSTVDLGSLFSK